MINLLENFYLKGFYYERNVVIIDMLHSLYRFLYFKIFSSWVMVMLNSNISINGFPPVL